MAARSRFGADRRTARLTRRRMVGLAAGGAAGAWLAACGSEKKSGDSDTSGAGAAMVSTATAQTAQAQPGGVFQDAIAREPGSTDPQIGTGADMGVAYWTYIRLLKRKTQFDGVARQEVTGDLAESYEFADGGLQLTLKLRPGVIWDRRAPTNGRPVDAEDVKWSSERFMANSSYAKDFFQSKSDVAPIISLTTPDSRTVVLKLAYPYMPLLAALSRSFNMWIMPREAESGFNPKTDVRGAGPWILEKWQPSAEMVYRKNPDYYEKDKPYLDGWSLPVIPEYAAQLAQFRAGRIWGGVVRSEDILATKKDFPQLKLYQGDFGVTPTILFFGYQGPFKDVRVRQAVSMTIDRQLFAETYSNEKEFKDAGLPTATRLSSHLGGGWPEWLDPNGSEIGPNGKFLRYDPAEARKLLQAAGVPIPLKTEFTVGVRPDEVTAKWIPTWIDMLNTSGLFQVKQENVDYATFFTPKRFYARGAWDGIATAPAVQGDDAGQQLQLQYHSQGTTTRQPPGEDPRLDAMIEAQLRETDTQKRTSLLQELQRYMPSTMIAAPVGFATRAFSLWWPWVGNAGTVRASVAGGTPQTEIYPYYWFDKAEYEKSKP